MRSGDVTGPNPQVAERMLELVDGYGRGEGGWAADSGRFVNIWSGDDIPW